MNEGWVGNKWTEKPGNGEPAKGTPIDSGIPGKPADAGSPGAGNAGAGNPDPGGTSNRPVDAGNPGEGNGGEGNPDPGGTSNRPVDAGNPGEGNGGEGNPDPGGTSNRPVDAGNPGMGNGGEGNPDPGGTSNRPVDAGNPGEGNAGAGNPDPGGISNRPVDAGNPGMGNGGEGNPDPGGTSNRPPDAGNPGMGNGGEGNPDPGGGGTDTPTVPTPPDVLLQDPATADWVSSHTFSLNDITGGFDGATVATDPSIIDWTTSTLTKEGVELHPIDSEFGFHVTDFIGAVDKLRDGIYGEGWAGNLPDGSGVVLSNSPTDSFMTPAKLGTWAAGLGGNSVKASTEHYSVMQAVLSDQKYPGDTTSMYALDDDLRLVDYQVDARLLHL